MSPLKRRLQRNIFVLFVGTAYIALIGALPIVTAQTQQQQRNAPPVSAAAGATAGTAKPAPDHPGFKEADRNRDGLLDKSEAGVVPGLSANFERADRNKDGKLDEVEFAGALEILSVRR